MLDGVTDPVAEELIPEVAAREHRVIPHANYGSVVEVLVDVTIRETNNTLGVLAFFIDQQLRCMHASSEAIDDYYVKRLGPLDDSWDYDAELLDEVNRHDESE